LPIPDFQKVMPPLMEFMLDGKEHSTADIRDWMTGYFKVTAEELALKIPSGRAKLFANRVAWAIAYFKMAEILTSPRRSIYIITEFGRNLAAKNPKVLNLKFLIENTVLKEKKKSWGSAEEEIEAESGPATEIVQRTPDELIDLGQRQILEELKSELLQRVLANTPSFFEHLVIDLLLAMGYGSSNDEYAEVTGKSGDGGIDGLIKEDKLGLDVIYVQAKRWQNPISGSEIQQFAGALQAKRAKKGIFITTSYFQPSALKFVQEIDTRIVLIDGAKLSELMVEYNVGVSLSKSILLKKIDSDYFVEE
jgi:restriction system protein